MTSPFPDFGSISTGTQRPEDLIPIFAKVLADLIQRNGERWSSDDGQKDREDFLQLIERSENLDFKTATEEEVNDVMESMSDALDSFSPPYAYFATHSDDAADYGFWLYSDTVEVFEGLKVADTSEVPADFTGEVLHVNDHGNMTLYNADNGTLTEVWSTV